jgi:hypothetical protein
MAYLVTFLFPARFVVRHKKGVRLNAYFRGENCIVYVCSPTALG